VRSLKLETERKNQTHLITHEIPQYHHKRDKLADCESDHRGGVSAQDPLLHFFRVGVAIPAGAGVLTPSGKAQSRRREEKKRKVSTKTD
jgi:hypothetical protein